MASPKKERIYILDSSVFINLNRINEHTFEIPQELWNKLDELMGDGIIISHRYVYEEVVMNSKKPDKVSAWLHPKKIYFPKETPQQVAHMIEVVQDFPKLVDVNSEREQADPWLVAQAREGNATHPHKEFVLVTQENQNKPTNLPAACRAYGVEAISLRNFFSERGITFGANFSDD